MVQEVFKGNPSQARSGGLSKRRPSFSTTSGRWFEACGRDSSASATERCFRPSELASLEVYDLVLGAAGLEVTLRHSKTEQERVGRIPYGSQAPTQRTQNERN
jgi:hypothetical protein